MISAKMLINNILETQPISLNKLASTLRIKPITITRILWADDEVCSLKTYIKLQKFQNKISQHSMQCSKNFNS